MEIGKNKSTLQSEVNRIDTSRKKIASDIAVTQNKITSATLELDKLGNQIVDKETRIGSGKSALGEALRSLQSIADTTLIEHFLSSRSGIASVWQGVDMLLTLESSLSDEIDTLVEAKYALTIDKEEVSVQKASLSSLKTTLSGQKTVLDENRKEQATLLTETKNKESEYQKIVSAKKIAKEQFERELNLYESQLNYTLDTNAIPAAGSGVLQFPLDPQYMQRCKDRQSTFKNLYCITQYFGDTPFARSGAYNGKGHNGIDFGVPEGTKVVAALSCIVQAVGNTDAYPGCYSYGKWMLIKHGNGLTTLYAHLSVVSVGQGTEVPGGAVIGYTGKTGYATGPHLHFTLYASEAVKLVKMGDIKSKTNCANAIVPVAATEGYLNPISYL